MLPFVRMFEYGNSRIVPYIKRIEIGLSSSFPNMVLLSSGDAYIGGYNDSGQLGNGTKNNLFRQMIKINATGIQHISCSASSSMYVSEDNKIYLAGDRAIQNVGGSASGYTVYTNVSSLFSTINIADIKKIVCDINTIVLLKNGDLYGIGLNRYGEFGLGSTGYKTFTKIASDVMDATCTAQVCVYMKNDGTLWGAGRNASYVIQTSTEGGVNNDSITTFRQIFSTVSEPILQVKVADSTVTAFTAFKAYSCGTNGSGGFGDGNTTNTNTNTSGVMITVNLNNECKRSSALDIVYRTQNAISMYVDVNNKLYSTGYNFNGSLGLGTATQVIATFTEVPNISIQNEDQICFNQYNSYIARVENNIFGCGANGNTAMTTDTFTNQFAKLNNLLWNQ